MRLTPTQRLLVFLGLALAALLLSVASRPGSLATALPADPERSAFGLWHLWYPAFALGRSDALAFGLPMTAWSGAPFLSNRLSWLPLLPSLEFAGLRGLGAGPALAFNLVLLSGQGLTALLMALWLSRRGASLLAASTGAFMLGAAPYFIWAAGRADVMAVQLWPLPLAFLLWDRALEKPDLRRSLPAALATWAALLCGSGHLLWLLGALLPWLLLRLWRRDHSPAGRDALALGAALFALLFLLYPGPALARQLLLNDLPASGGLLAMPLHSLPGWALRVGLVPLLAMLAALLIAPPRGEGWFWPLAALGGLLMGIGLLPELSVMLRGLLGLPAHALYEPTLGIGLGLFAASTAAIEAWTPLEEALHGLLSRFSPRAAPAALAALLITGTLGTSLFALRYQGHSPVAAPAPIYAELRADPEDYLVLHLPFGLRSLGDDLSYADEVFTDDLASLGQPEGAWLAVNSLYHEKRSIGGLAPYFDPAARQNLAGQPFLFPGEPPDGDAAQALVEAVHSWRIGYVFVHAGLISAESAAAFEQIAAQSGALCAPFTQDDLIIYRAQWHPAGCAGE